MANDLNQCNFIGRLGKDPESRFLADGKAVANFSIAVSSSWKDKDGAKWEATEWVRINVFGKLAEICTEYLKKGSQVFISGSMKTRKWQDKDGSDRYTTEITANDMKMLGAKPDGVGQGKADDAFPAKPAAPVKPQGKFDDMDDDVPF